MRLFALRRGLFVALVVSCVACGGSRTKHGLPSASLGGDDGGLAVCVDNDGDGFGLNCPRGPDCDDNDPNITNECVRCRTPSKNCPCTPGSQALKCTPLAQKVDGGTLVCSEGSRYCRTLAGTTDAYWSDCEFISQYTSFVKTAK